MTDPQLYTELKYWMPLISAFLLIIKAYSTAKTKIAGFCHTLLNNHLSHIESATTSTELETKKTNSLLSAQSDKLERVQAMLSNQHGKQLEVWQGIVESLVILKERTAPRRTPRKRRI
jgi:hypothetical protein